MIQLILPWPPTMNTMYGRSAKSVFVRPNSRAYRKQVADCVVEQLRHFPRLSGRLKVTYACNPPDLRTRDLDNLLKNLQDSLSMPASGTTTGKSTNSRCFETFR